MLLERYTNNKYISFTHAYLVLTCLLFLFLYNPGGNIFNNPVVFYINAYPLKIHFAAMFGVMGLFFLIFYKKIIIDTPTIALSLLCVFVVLSNLKNNFSDVASHMAVFVVTLISYIIAKNDRCKTNSIANIFVLFGTILFVQVVATYILNGVSYFSPTYKYYMNIPIGGTNIIAAYLNMCISFLLLSKEKIAKKVVFIALFALGVFLTKSRTGLLLLCFIVVLAAFTVDKKNRKIIFGLLFVGLCLMLIFRKQVFSLIIGDRFKGNTFFEIVDTVSSGRLSIIVDTFKLFLQKPLLGWGCEYYGGYVGAHNFVVELLFQTGIIGCSLYLAALFFCLKAIFKCKCSALMPYRLMILTILINGLFELTIFNYFQDVVLWIMIGKAMSITRTYNQKTLQGRLC